jgi:hypothetical protein
MGFQGVSVVLVSCPTDNVPGRAFGDWRCDRAPFRCERAPGTGCQGQHCPTAGTVGERACAPASPPERGLLHEPDLARTVTPPESVVLLTHWSDCDLDSLIDAELARLGAFGGSVDYVGHLGVWDDVPDLPYLGGR